MPCGRVSGSGRSAKTVGSRLERQVYVELETAHDYQVIPEFAVVFFAVAVGREEGQHCIDNGFCTAVALIAVGDVRAVVDHLLYIAAVLWKYELWEVCVICKHSGLLVFQAQSYAFFCRGMAAHILKNINPPPTPFVMYSKSSV